jgi:anti-sigma regulatory factor (Ser/Thr protein kinase)
VAPCIQDRWVHPSCRDRKVFVEVQIGQRDARFVVRDQGAGFTQATIPERHDPKTLERGQGRGLVLMRHFMDEVAFNEKGNEVTLVKYRTQRTNGEG